MKLKNAYLLSNNGLGDNTIMNGSVIFLLNYYETIHFICKDIYLHHMKYLYKNHPNVILVTFNPNNELTECSNIIYDKYENNDIFTAGYTFSLRFPNKITHPDLLNYNKNRSIIFPEEYSFINDLYNDIQLDLSICVDYFTIESDNNIYQSISNYNIVFIHTDSSVGSFDWFDDKIYEYIENESILMICVNKNVYPKNHPYNEIANKFVLLPTIFHYIDIIQNAVEIYITDSCFSCIVLPLYYASQNNKNKLVCKNPIIYYRVSKKAITL